MEFGDNFFDAPPTEWADVPVAAMRALARQQAAPAPTMPSTASRPRVRQIQADVAPPAPAQAPPPEMRLPRAPANQETRPSEAESVVKQVATALTPKKEDPLKARMAELERRLAAARGAWLDSAPSGPLEPIASGGNARPRVYSPLDAPDTGEADLSDAPTGYFQKNRAFESGNNPRATNPITGAGGDYQFLPSTWRGLMQEAPHLGLTMDGLYDSKQQDAAMRYYTGKSVAILKPMLGRAPTGGELYAAHLLGHSGGPALIAGQDKPLPEIIDPRAIAANPWLKKFATGRDLLAELNKRFG